MSILPPQTPLEFLLYDPIGSVITFLILLMCLLMALKFAVDYSTMKLQFDMTSICFGGGCPAFSPDFANITTVEGVL